MTLINVPNILNIPYTYDVLVILNGYLWVFKKLFIFLLNSRYIFFSRFIIIRTLNYSGEPYRQWSISYCYFLFMRWTFIDKLSEYLHRYRIDFRNTSSYPFYSKTLKRLHLELYYTMLFTVIQKLIRLITILLFQIFNNQIVCILREMWTPVVIVEQYD